MKIEVKRTLQGRYFVFFQGNFSIQHFSAQHPMQQTSYESSLGV